ncbi:MAG: RDD family protein [Nanoarchaeota archaeon]
MELFSPKRGKAIVAEASILKRALAFAIDILFVEFVILFPFSSVLEEIVPEESSFYEAFSILSSGSYDSLLGLVAFFTAIPTIAYFAILEKKIGQTIGKRLLNLYVVSQTKELKYWQAFVRSIFLIPIFPFVLLWIIDPVVMFFSKERQRLSEILSRTKVVERYNI